MEVIIFIGNVKRKGSERHFGSSDWLEGLLGIFCVVRSNIRALGRGTRKCMLRG